MRILIFFFFNDAATTEIYTLSLHDALPIFCLRILCVACILKNVLCSRAVIAGGDDLDRKSTRLNSSHTVISYAVFCLKKKRSKRKRLAPTLTLHTESHSKHMRTQTVRNKVT